MDKWSFGGMDFEVEAEIEPTFLPISNDPPICTHCPRTIAFTFYKLVNSGGKCQRCYQIALRENYDG